MLWNVIIDREKKNDFWRSIFLDYENIGFIKSQNLQFSKGVSPWFSSKNRDFVNFSFYAKYTEEKYLVTFLLENKTFQTIETWI